MKKTLVNKRFYKERCYTYSPIRECWKIYHSSQQSFMLMNFDTEKEVKQWVNKKIKQGVK